ncbi:hypothetical protein AC482_05030 [miscellaneous Crenarchaeota group-15 archaeon DG-45]|uniref:Uncharacterized protein n=1 Tax=miscellaneous Crenarchaeota group-15 archaeon DG-45 TaxID=1685127 RepID=A0A0M0BN65_9ARCH|nr:MAG: hypothetical protein AC482_05030 [miscellaneous Crenarchaeota group-15 archaeon DG-45]
MKTSVQTLRRKDAEQGSEVVESMKDMLVRLANGWEVTEVLGLEKFLMRKRACERPNIQAISAAPRMEISDSSEKRRPSWMRKIDEDEGSGGGLP